MFNFNETLYILTKEYIVFMKKDSFSFKELLQKKNYLMRSNSLAKTKFFIPFENHLRNKNKY